MKYKIYYFLVSVLILTGCEEKTEELKFSEYGVVNSMNPSQPIAIWPAKKITISDISYGESSREWSFTEGTLVNGIGLLRTDAGKVTLQFPEAGKTYTSNLHIEFKYPVIYYTNIQGGYGTAITETSNGNPISKGDTIRTIDWTLTITVADE